ncbi:MAG: aspartyl protease family protein [Verrucomicrobiaceae bacterium]|nr:aspartyl protease family protein [Verrucomicrobiaceae bacterium]
MSASVVRQLERQTLSPDVTREKMQVPERPVVTNGGEGTVMLSMDVSSRLPLIRAGINDSRHKPFLFDSGSAYSLLQATTAIQNKVVLFDPELIPIRVTGIAGKESVRGGLVTLNLGDWRAQSVPTLVRTHRTDMAMLGAIRTESLDVDIIGLNPLRSLCSFITLDYRRRQFVLGGTNLFQPLGEARGVPLIFINGLPHIMLSSGGRQWISLVDTGSAYGIEIPLDVAKQIGADQGAIPVLDSHQIGIGGSVDVQKLGVSVTRIKRIDGLGRPLLDFPVAIRPGEGRIGSNFLRNYRITFDFRRKLFVVE